MPPIKKDVKKNLLDHSSAKVRLLGNYLDSYLSIISNDGYTRRIKLYDLFCGEGMYDDGGEGSPLVELMCIRRLHESANRSLLPIDCYFNDINKQKIAKLQGVIANMGYHQSSYGKLDFSETDYQLLIKQVISDARNLKNEKAFVFIDPYGYKHINAKDIKDLVDTGKSEVLLFLPTQFMYRFDANGTPESLIDFIDELTDIKQWRKNASVWDFINQLTESFRNYLSNGHFVDTFTIQKDAQTVFCLFFFCSHIRGFEKMLQAKWDIDTEQGKGWEYHDTGNSLFASQKTNPLEEKLLLYLKEPKSNGQVYEYTLHCGFLPTHATEVLTAWQKGGRLITKQKNGSKVRAGSFYINYKCYKDETDKITIQTA